MVVGVEDGLEVALVRVPTGDSRFSYGLLKYIDLTGISRLEVNGFGNGRAGTFTVELRSGQPNGPILSKGALTFGADRQPVKANLPIPKTTGNQLQDLYLVFRQQGSGGRAYLKSVAFIPES